MPGTNVASRPILDVRIDGKMTVGIWRVKLMRSPTGRCEHESYESGRDGVSVEVETEPARVDECQQIADLYSDAFAADPVWSAIVPKEKARRRIIRESFFQELRAGGYRNVDVVRESDGTVVGALNFLPPGVSKVRPNLWFRMRSQIADRLSPSARRGNAHDQAVWSHRPKEPHWYFRDLVASPAARGRGIGSALLDRRLQIVDLDPVPVFLESTTEASKRLYERFGFEHVDTVNALGTAPAFIMVRPPQR
mgnify:CR=1 FL=1